MRVSSFLAPLFLAATTLAQAVEEGIEPASSAPEGCRRTIEGTFEIGTLENPTLKKSKRETAQEAADGALSCTLKDGILHDQYGRTGSVVANRQFQFDGPPQAGAIYTGGFSVCGNDSLAIGGTTRWWRCMSGAFGNLYDEWIGAQCHEIRIQAIFPAEASASLATSASTVKASEVAGASPTDSAASNVSQTDSASGSAAASASAFPTASAFTTTPSASGAARSSGPSADAAAPPAATGAASSLSVASGAVFALIGAAFIM